MDKLAPSKEEDDPPKSSLINVGESSTTHFPPEPMDVNPVGSEEDVSDTTLTGDDQGTKDPKDPKPKMGGAARKRFKWLVMHGHDPKEARALAMHPMEKHTSKDKGPKRPRSEDNSPKEKIVKKAKQVQQSATEASTSASYKQTLECKRVGILPAQYPEVLLTTEQLKAIQDDILNKIIENKKGTIKPSFLGSTYKPGWMILSCADEATVEWLRSIAPQIKPWEGADLRVVDEAELPRPKILVGYFPNSEKDNNSKILDFVEGQNQGLEVSEWRVLRRTTENKTALLTLSIDQKSDDKLKTLNYKVNYKFGLVQLRPKGNKPGATAMDVETAKATEGPGPSVSSATTRKAPHKKGKPQGKPKAALESSAQERGTVKQGSEKPHVTKTPQNE